MKKILSSLLTVSLFFPGLAKAALISCGRSADSMCTLCDIIVGFSNLMNYGYRIAMFVGLAGATIAGVMYIVSAGDPGLKKQANEVLWNVLKGFAWVFGAWFVVMVLLWTLAADTGLGLERSGFATFSCDIK